MDLFLNIDYKKTAINVHGYLDTKLPRLLRMVNESPSSLKLPIILDMLVNYDNGKNHNEEKLIRYIAAKDMLNQHINEPSGWQIARNMDYSKARYFRSIQ